MKTLELRTPQTCCLLDITAQVSAAVAEQGLWSGWCLVTCPHTTAAITVNENADPDVPRDVLLALERAVPREAGYRHAEGNSAAHVKSSLVGVSQTLAVEEGRLVLGRWQAVFFCEFDGPRQRRVHVQVGGLARDGRLR